MFFYATQLLIPVFLTPIDFLELVYIYSAIFTSDIRIFSSECHFILEKRNISKGNHSVPRKERKPICSTWKIRYFYVVQRVWSSALHQLVTNATCTFSKRWRCHIIYNILYIVLLNGRWKENRKWPQNHPPLLDFVSST